MNLKNILQNISIIESKGSLDKEISEIVFDSRKAVENCLYIAIKGVAADGHNFIKSAIENGATAIVYSSPEASPQPLSQGEGAKSSPTSGGEFQNAGLPHAKAPSLSERAGGEENSLSFGGGWGEELTFIRVSDSNENLGKLASNFYGNPSEKLTLVGVTGTNGKTSVSTLLFDVFKNLGYASALISTVEYRIGDEVFPSTHTTPDVLTLNKILAQAVENGCQYAFMEVSSHGIHQGRINGLNFQIAGFTNLTHDHLDYHKTFLEYLNTKKKFFDNLPKDAVAITNLDDKNGSVMLQNTKAKKKTYATKTLADYHGKFLEGDFGGMQLNFNGKEFWTALTGKFNVYNLLLVFSIAKELGFETDEVLMAISKLKRVNGRFETLKSESGIVFVVDYAHTPDALENVIDSINEIRTKNERLITVFGCGGDRDREKRPEMGKIATQKSTLAIITSDNPRTEDPTLIIKEIEAGVEAQNFSKFVSITDRKEAIKMAIKFAEPKDIILVAGKGHETYQEIHGVKHHFDDREVIAELLKMMGK